MVSAISTSKYQDGQHGFFEFINRGKVRAEKSKNLVEALQDVENERQDLKKLIPELLKMMSDQEQKSPEVFLEAPKSHTISSGFCEGLNGKERGLCLEQSIRKAEVLCSDASTMRHAIALINRVQAEYEKKAVHFLNVARDARHHYLNHLCGWTWWR